MYVSLTPNFDTLGPFGILPNVPLQLHVNESRYKVLLQDNEISKLNKLQLQIDNLDGSLSPLTPVTLNEHSRKVAHIPNSATNFAFAYPCLIQTVFTDSLDHAKVERAVFAGNSVISFLCIGGYVYFDENYKVVSVNALTTGYSLWFARQKPLHKDITEKLTEQLRWQPVTLASVRSTGANDFAWLGPHEFEDIFGEGGNQHGSFAYRFDSSSLNRYFEIVDLPVTTYSAIGYPGVREEEAKKIQMAIDSAGGFAAGYPALCKGKSYSLQNDVPFQLRLATAFLCAIGRNPTDKDIIVKSGKGHYEYHPDEPEPLGLPTVTLQRPLHELADNQFISFSAKNAEGWLRQWYGTKVIDEKLAKAGVTSLQEIFGDQEMRLQHKEIKDFERSAHIRTGRSLPAYFYMHLAKILSQDSNVQFFCDHKSDSLQDLMSGVCGDPSHPAQIQLAQFLQKVSQFPHDYGFKIKKDVPHLSWRIPNFGQLPWPEPDLNHTMAQSLTELSTNVVISILGHFLCGNYNQITELKENQHPILFVSTAGIDFDEPDRHKASAREEQKYFQITRLPDGTVAGEFKPGARQALKDRIKETYDMVYSACQAEGVTHPGFIPMGLGVFLPRVQSSEVKLIYHEAQFELLSERHYSFNTVFLNPGPARPQVEKLLKEEPYRFKCNLVLHSKNGKYLAQELARAGYKTCLLNPSDCISTMMGCMGYWWEIGMGDRYLGEEDIMATSTAILARSNISTVYQSARIISHK